MKLGDADMLQCQGTCWEQMLINIQSSYGS